MGQIINGREYTMWNQFVEKQQEFIGGTLEDFGDSMDRMLGCKPMQTEITGIELQPNGTDSAFFSVNGKDFDCGFDVQHGGIAGGEEGWLTFSGYGGHTWRIKQPIKE
jgi:hypothetical protein